MEISVETRVDMDPCPRVRVTVTDIPAGATVTLGRSWGTETAGVRGVPTRQIFGGSILITDYEVPPHTTVTYTCTASTGDAATASADLSWPFGWWDTVIMQDPLAPQTARAAILTEEALDSLVIAVGGDLVRPHGSNLPLAIGGTAYAPSDMLLQWYAENEDQHRDFLDLITGRPILIRSLEPVPLPPLAYVKLTGVTIQREKYIQADWQRMRTYSGYASLVRPPAASIVVPTYTWADYAVDYEGLDHDDFAALQAGKTWLDWQRDPERPNA